MAANEAWTVVLIAAVLAGSAALTAAVLPWLRRRAVLDRPSERSLHRSAIPRGGGLAVIPALAAGWIVAARLDLAPSQAAVIAVIALALALFSFRDDIQSLPIAVRLAAHFGAAIVGLHWLPGGMVFQGLLPPLADHVVAALLWVWFINLYNFMDGIDGITAVETLSLGLGAAAVTALAGSAADGSAVLALIAAAAAAGFLRWNWHPAKLFLGDAGSVPLGFVIGWLLLSLAARGEWAPALILPLYYLADATLTLLRRLGNGEKFWQAHRMHFYQRAAARDGNHAEVARAIALGDAALIGAALIAVMQPWIGLALGIVVAGLMLVWLARRAG
jgi:UDP-N-acetylmuramyl pentapeptide phosphotransferase/UDP-N-acetylglucosamine-1-phosphate transferase